uniref:threonine--tRNA ligase n=1 Tax=Meloidogyne enterolobii TaxID=390850 RepID=A0A6V7TLG8_MELEN|nr:unnamed protein product [Meloidogyne enterolobii]
MHFLQEIDFSIVVCHRLALERGIVPKNNLNNFHVFLEKINLITTVPLFRPTLFNKLLRSSISVLHRNRIINNTKMDPEEAAKEEAAKRDHRKIGKDQELFVFIPMSPGSAFWYPKGTFIYNTLVNFMRQEYRKRGFLEVMTPNIYNVKLWEQSGHWHHYADNMFKFEIEKEQYGLKPMNCPGHVLMFDHKPRSYNELPIRYADFGVLHRFFSSYGWAISLMFRNEMSGALGGLTRLRRFQQDDAHIFCRSDQLADEITACLDFLNFVYVDSYLGDISSWELAEKELSGALESSGHDWELNAGDGAFYGPKIDMQIVDALGRYWQTATIQLDFQQPQRFDLHYFDENKERHRPVMIHRAILGSVERLIAILAENYAGKWPFWLSPRQAKIICVHPNIVDYATQVKEKIFNSGFEIEFDEDCPDTLNKRIRNAQLEQFNFILVVGKREKENGTVNVRTRDNQVRGEMKVEDLIKKFAKFRDTFAKDTESAEAFVEENNKEE